MKYLAHSLIGEKFGRLTIDSIAPRNIGDPTYYNCICECGNTCTVLAGKLKSAHTRSCGCLKKEIYRGYNKLPEGVSSRNRLLGMYKYNAKKRDISII